MENHKKIEIPSFSGLVGKEVEGEIMTSERVTELEGVLKYCIETAESKEITDEAWEYFFKELERVRANPMESTLSSLSKQIVIGGFMV